PQTFHVVPLRKGALEGAPYEEVAVFWRALEDATRRSSAVGVALKDALKKGKAMQVALTRARAVPGDVDAQLHEVRQALLALDGELNGLATKREVGEKTKPTIGARLAAISRGVYRSTYGPTETDRDGLAIVNTQLSDVQKQLVKLQADLSALGKTLIEAGAPWVEGEGLPE
ncbi:MAG: hypothetical protein WBW88_17775, partial [Rhodothermales bacterium]